MFNRDFERFLLEQVQRERAMYYGIMIAFGFCSLACAVMAIAAPIVFGLGYLGISLKLMILFLFFAGLCYAGRSIALKSREAAEEMSLGLEDPEFIVPEDYTDETIDARERVCRNLKSIRGLILSYGIIAVMLWAVTVLLVGLGGLGMPDYNLMLLLASFITFAMALALSILTIAYIRDLPAARKYRQLIKDESDEE